MGWLRDLMRSAPAPLDGYGDLARRCLAHTEWPSDTQPQARSLAALFSKLDRCIELEWLADRDAVQRTLALILACPLDTIQKVLTPLSDPANTAGRVRFTDLPYARPLELEEEPLPPGIPREVLHPAAWGRLWWYAPSGSGRSLAGQWLRARGLAAFCSGRTWEDVAERLPAAGPVFVELERPVSVEVPDRVLGRSGVCVATAAFPPDRGTSSSTLAAWQLIESPSPATILAPLLDWIEARLPRDGAFEAEAARSWLEAPVQSGQLPNLGALIGAAGLLDVRSVREAEGKTLKDLAARFVNERLEQASQKGSSEAQWLKRYGFDVIVKLAEGVLTTRDEPWGVARTQDEWMELIPNEFRQSVDTEWVRWSLARAGGHSTVRELERALRNVPPGAYRLVRALSDAGLLAARGSARDLAVQPEFLKHVALVQARSNLLAEASPFGWGEALLHAHAAPGLLELLCERLANDDFRLVDSLFELDLGSNPALVAATEAIFVGLGLRVLAGADVPMDQVRAIWNEQLGWIIELPGELPRPRLVCFESSSGHCALASRAIWGLAALALSEALGTHPGAEHAVLRPWTGAPRSKLLPRLLDEIATMLARPDVARQSWAVESFALAGRLEVREGEPAAHADVHQLARPAFLVRSLIAGNIDPASLAGFGSHPLDLRALRAECELQRIPWQRMAEALWRAWREAGCPASSEALFAPASNHAEALWPHIPAPLMDSIWSRWASSADAWPYTRFGPNQWAAFVSCWRRRWLDADLAAPPVAAFHAMELEWAERAVREGDVLHAPSSRASAVVSVLWQRFPAWALQLVVENVERGDAVALSLLLGSVPAQGHAGLVRALSESLSKKSAPRAALDEARRWLLLEVTSRAPGWREAYALLAELEQRRARAARARGAVPSET